MVFPSAVKPRIPDAFAVADALTTKTSVSVPPLPPRSTIVSVPESTLKVSLPAFPVMESLAAPPVRVSSPPLPIIVSASSPPAITSALLPPFSVSAPVPPVIVKAPVVTKLRSITLPPDAAVKLPLSTVALFCVELVAVKPIIPVALAVHPEVMIKMS